MRGNHIIFTLESGVLKSQMRMKVMCAYFVATIAAGPALACLCPGIPTVERSRKDAVAIFEGVVVEKRVVVTKNWDGWFTPANEYDFAVIHLWKGRALPKLTLRGGLGGCSRHFAPGRRYVVFAVNGSDRGSLTDLDCGTTHRVRTRGEAPISYMGTPSATFREPAPEALPPGSPPMWYTRRAHIAAGAAVFANLATHGAETGDRVSTAPLAMVISGLMCVLVLLVGIAASFGKTRRAVGLLILAILLTVVTFGVAGRLYIADPKAPSELVWPLTYMVPEAIDS